MPSSAIPFPERYRLVVVDVDGTLLDSQHQLPARVATAVRAIQQHGIAVALATGKMLVAVRPLIEAMGLRGPQITLNGAALVLAETGEPLVYHPLRAEDRRLVIETVRAANPEILITHFMLDHILLDQPGHPLLPVLLSYGEKDEKQVHRCWQTTCRQPPRFCSSAHTTNSATCAAPSRRCSNRG